MPVYSDEFFESLPEDVFAALDMALSVGAKFINDQPKGDNSNEWLRAKLEYLLEIETVVTQLMEVNDLDLQIVEPEYEGLLEEDCGRAEDYLREIRAELTLKSMVEVRGHIENRLVGRIKPGFHYKLEQNELEALQQKVNEMRAHIKSATTLDEKHRQRLLDDLESLQRSLNRRMSKIDSLLSLAIDASVAARIVGENLLPITKIAREIADIWAQAKARAEGLESTELLEQTGMLGDSGNDEDC